MKVRMKRRLPPFLVLLLTSLCFSATSHTFRYHHEGENPPASVSVAGDFNGWSTSANPMTAKGNGHFELTLPLSEGVHHYKFVLDGNRWTNDPKHSDKELERGDNHGGVNSAVFIGFDVRKLPKPAPNHINPEAIRHDPKDSADVNVVDSYHVRFRLRAQADDVQTVDVVLTDPTSGKSSTVPLFNAGTAMGFDAFATLAAAPTSPTQYHFVLKDGTATKSLEPIALDVRPTFTTPAWAKDAVWYQIFPERFRNGDPSNDPPGTQRWQSKWFSTLPGEPPGPQNFYKGQGNVWKRRYGGDVQGLRQSLPYLKKLGINAIYLNPIFEAESMHKYDATDFRHIDDNFGVKGDLAKLEGETDDPATWKWSDSDKLFLDFIAEAHRHDIKVIIDGVFNHVGRDHWAFQDVLKNGKNSKYADWFDVRDWNPPIKYIAWDKGNEPTSDGALPVFRKDDKLGLVPGPREHILAVTRRWTAPDGDPSRGVDGWRLDVPGDIPHPFWVEFRKTVKSLNPDAYITGEIWGWSQAWLQGDQFDAVMNYRFADAAQQFFVNRKTALPPSQFASKLSEMVNAYPLQVSLVQQNLFDSHDTDRLASMFVNPDLPYDAKNRLQDNGPDYSPRKPSHQEWSRLKQAVVCQMTFLGAPMIYYGDEAGMWSPDDPSNRQPMIWEDLQPFDDPAVKFDKDLFAHYQKLINLRHQLKPLRWGYFRPLLTQDNEGVLAYARTLGPNTVYVVLNRSAGKRTVSLPVGNEPQLINWLDNKAQLQPKSGIIQLNLDPYGSAILSAPELGTRN